MTEGAVIVKHASLSSTSTIVLFLAGTVLWSCFVLSPAPHVERIQITSPDSPTQSADGWDCPESHVSLGHLPLWTCYHPFSLTPVTPSILSAYPESGRFSDFHRTGWYSTTFLSSSLDYHPLPYRPPARLL